VALSIDACVNSRNRSVAGIEKRALRRILSA